MANYGETFRARPATADEARGSKTAWTVVKVGPYPGRVELEIVSVQKSEEEAQAVIASLMPAPAPVAEELPAPTEPAPTPTEVPTSTETEPTAEVPAAETPAETAEAAPAAEAPAETPAEAIPTEGTTAARKRR